LRRQTREYFGRVALLGKLGSAEEVGRLVFI
jgi:hypothetical protein